MEEIVESRENDDSKVEVLKSLSLMNTDLAKAIETGKFDPAKEYNSISLYKVTNNTNLQVTFRTENLHFSLTNINMINKIRCKNLSLSSCKIDNNLIIESNSIDIIACSSKNKEIKVLDTRTIRIVNAKNFKVNIVKANKVFIQTFNNTKFLTLGDIDTLELFPRNNQFIEIPVHQSLKHLNLKQCYVNGNFAYFQLEGLSLNNCTLKGDLKLYKKLKHFELDTFTGDINRELIDIKDTLEFLNLKNIDMKFFVNVYTKLKSLTLIKCEISKIYNLNKSPLETLNINNNNLTELPEISDSVTNLDVSFNAIRSLNNLSSSLKLLNLRNNVISYIPKLPDNLEVFDCSENQKLKGLPILPDSIKELYLNDCNVFELPKELPKELTILECTKNKLSKLPKLPKTLKKLDCSFNLLKKMTNLPESLTEINGQGNFLSEIPSLPSKLTYINFTNNKIRGKVSLKSEFLVEVNLSNNLIEYVEFHSNILFKIDLDYNLLKEMPTFINKNPKNKIVYLNPRLYVRYNQIDTLKNFEFLRNFCQDYIEGNPIEKQIFKGIESPEFDYEEREYKNMKVSIATIPKGTVLFRGYYKDEKSSILNDFIGFPIPETTKHRVIPYANVFFYPYPFITERILDTPMYEMISVVTRPIKVALNILPSLNYRAEKNKGDSYITSCSNIKWKGYQGNSYDPCFTKEFLRENPDVVGNVAIAFMDTNAQKCLEVKDVDFNRYHRLFSDVLNTGIPEFIMYPLKERVMKDVVTDSKIVTPEWMTKHLSDFNYFPLYVVNNREEMKTTIDELLSPNGLKHPDATFGETLHMSIDPRTKFFVIPELTEPHVLKRLVPISESDKLSLL